MNMDPNRKSPRVFKETKKRKTSNSFLSSSTPEKKIDSSFRVTHKLTSYVSRFETLASTNDAKDIMSKYLQYSVIQKELETNFPLKIPLNAYIDKNTWHLVIKVNNEADHLKVQQLGEIKKAFDKGLKLLVKKKTFHLAIHHVDEDVDLNKSAFAKIREDNAITEVKRLTSREGVSLRTLKIVIALQRSERTMPLPKSKDSHQEKESASEPSRLS